MDLEKSREKSRLFWEKRLQGVSLKGAKLYPNSLRMVKNRWVVDANCRHGRKTRRAFEVVERGAITCAQCSADDRNLGEDRYNLLSRFYNMKERCYNKESDSYQSYGGRGIGVCQEWLNNPEGFVRHVTSLPNFSLKLSLDRVNNDGNYEPGNLRWATRTMQAVNRRSSHNIIFNGEQLCLTHFIKKYVDLSEHYAKSLIRQGITAEELLCYKRKRRKKSNE